MCGIVGYVGSRDLESVLIVGLERLSYRGYDSAGIASLDKNELSILGGHYIFPTDEFRDLKAEIEKNLGMEAKLNMMPMQDGDVRKSHADVNDLVRDFNCTPKWNIKDGIKRFIQWYLGYYGA